MKNAINLATPKTVGKRAIRKVFLSSIICFALTFVTALGLLIYQIILNSKITVIENDKKNIINEIAKLSNRKEKTIIIKERISSIKKIIDTRKPINKQVLLILDEFPQSLVISAISAKDNFVQIGTESQSLLELEDLIDNRILSFANSNKSSLQKIDIESFSRSTSGNYSVSLDFYFKGAVIKAEKG